MPVSFQNIKFISAFIRNTDRTTRDSGKYAKIFSDNLEHIILDRVEKSKFLSGSLQNAPYSENPIKAYKLGWANVSGQGMDKQLTINGILIDDEDWYWGEWDRDKKNITVSFARSGVAFGDSTPKPVPIFVPGYKQWRIKYNNLSPNVDLQFTGNMIDNFEVDMYQAQGANQYGSKWNYDFIVEEPFRDIGEMTDYYRGWLQVTEDEIRQAASEVSDKIINFLFSGG